MTITVDPVNDDPVAEDDTTLTDLGTAVTIDVLANDSDLDGDNLTVANMGLPADGTTAINPDNTITYTPTATFTSTDTFTYTVSDGNGGTDTALVTIIAYGKIGLIKLTDGLPDSSMIWNFTLSGPGLSESDATPPTLLDFNDASLIPGETYTLCEVGIPAGWTSEWQGDGGDGGTADTIIPIVVGTNTDPVDPTLGYSGVFDPNYVPSPGSYTNDTRCVNFEVQPGQTKEFVINNTFPGGDSRSIGFWKNWNTCTGGNQTNTAANNGGPAAGWYILDDLLNDPGYIIGNLLLGGSDCEDAVNILDMRQVTGNHKKMSNDGAYKLAAQLLAAQLNLSAGAETCQEVVDAVNDGQALLAAIGFNGSGSYLSPSDGQLYLDAIAQR